MTVSATTAASAATPSGSTQTALSNLSGNYTDFLTLLTTQLKNQDPTSPLDTNQFTSQLVQYSTVEQQINTNSNLSKLIQATQSNTVLQSSSLIGKQVDVTSDHVALQDAAAAAHFNSPAAQTVNIGIYSESGAKILQTTIKTQAGNNDWTWDGKDGQGNVLPDGSYAITVVDPSGTALPTTVTGRVTGLQRTASGVMVSMGALSASVDSVQSVATAS